MARPTLVRVPKPRKPYRDFPLHQKAVGPGYWAKKILGRTYYFGRWADGWQAALAEYDRVKVTLFSGGRIEDVRGGSGSLLYVCNHFLEAKERRVIAGQLTRRYFDELKATCGTLLETIGPNVLADSLQPTDFDKLYSRFAKEYGVTRLGNEIGRVKQVFNHADACGLIERLPRYGTNFRRPPRRLVRLQAASNETPTFEATELQLVLKESSPQLAAMILLGINCGLGNHDIGGLTWDHLDLRGGWLNYPRNKTGIPRHANLWPETIAALRKIPRGNPVFRTKFGKAWKYTAISHEFGKLLDEVKLRAAKRNFYALRHTFETVAGDCADQVAVDVVMGHATPGMGTTYRHSISDERLIRVAETVRKWFLAGRSRNNSEHKSRRRINGSMRLNTPRGNLGGNFQTRRNLKSKK